jgi:hypothetical protein
LIGPSDRKVDQSGETEAAREATIDGGFDEIGREERQRQGHADRSLAFAFSSGDRFNGLGRAGQKPVQPAMRFAKSFGENETSACRQRSDRERSGARLVDDLASAIPRRVVERLGAGGRLQTQRRPLIGPSDRQADQSGETKAAGKATIDSGHDKVGREERQ